MSRSRDLGNMQSYGFLGSSCDQVLTTPFATTPCPVVAPGSTRQVCSRRGLWGQGVRMRIDAGGRQLVSFGSSARSCSVRCRGRPPWDAVAGRCRIELAEVDLASLSGAARSQEPGSPRTLLRVARSRRGVRRASAPRTNSGPSTPASSRTSVPVASESSGHFGVMFRAPCPTPHRVPSLSAFLRQLLGWARSTPMTVSSALRHLDPCVVLLLLGPSPKLKMPRGLSEVLHGMRGIILNARA